MDPRPWLLARLLLLTLPKHGREVLAQDQGRCQPKDNSPWSTTPRAADITKSHQPRQTATPREAGPVEFFITLVESINDFPWPTKATLPTVTCFMTKDIKKDSLIEDNLEMPVCLEMLNDGIIILS